MDFLEVEIDVTTMSHIPFTVMSIIIDAGSTGRFTLTAYTYHINMNAFRYNPNSSRCTKIHFPVVNSIYCSITVNHRLTGPGKMVELCLLFVGKFQIQKFD